VGKLPAIISPPTTQKIEQQKKQKNWTNQGLTTAPLPPNPISMHCSRPPAPFLKKFDSFCKEITDSGNVTA
jgi:hypothetical protein